MAIELECGYDGANPQDAAAVKKLGEGRFRVAPFSEDGDANYKFALNVKAINPSRSDEALTLEIDWGTIAYMENRGFVYVGRGDDWRFVPGTVDGALTTVQLAIPPGETGIGLSPAYGLADHQAYLERLLPTTAFAREVIGQSDQGREIEAFRIGRGGTSVLVIARLHPYETAASFCTEGLMTWLGSPGASREKILSDFHFVIVPMPNPDGVYLGLCKRTGLTGSDLSHEAVDRRDAPAQLLMDLIDDLQPAALLDIHGWMHLDEDGIGFVDETQQIRFVAEIQRHPLFQGNRWLGTNATLRANAGNPRLYAYRRYGTRAIDLSYRFPGRTVAQMRDVGAVSLRAFCA